MTEVVNMSDGKAFDQTLKNFDSSYNGPTHMLGGSGGGGGMDKGYIDAKLEATEERIKGEITSVRGEITTVHSEVAILRGEMQTSQGQLAATLNLLSDKLDLMPTKTAMLNTAVITGLTVIAVIVGILAFGSSQYSLGITAQQPIAEQPPLTQP